MNYNRIKMIFAKENFHAFIKISFAYFEVS